MLFEKDELVNTFQLKNAIIRGENLMSRCPNYILHTNKTDNHQSFGINLETGESHCFSCGLKAGSIRSLANILGVYIPKELLMKSLNVKIKQKKERVFYKTAFNGNYMGAYAKLKHRGVSLEAVMKTNTTYDEATDKIIFPCYDPTGNITGFSIRSESFAGRYGVFPEGVEKKYMLFGIYPNNNPLYLVEGNVDALKLIGWGYYSIATCGNYITKEQADYILSTCSKIVLVPDIDSGGRIWWKQAIRWFKGKVPISYKLVPKEYKDVGHKDITEEIFNQIEEKFI